MYNPSSISFTICSSYTVTIENRLRKGERGGKREGKLDKWYQTQAIGSVIKSNLKHVVKNKPLIRIPNTVEHFLRGEFNHSLTDETVSSQHTTITIATAACLDKVAWYNIIPVKVWVSGFLSHDQHIFFNALEPSDSIRAGSNIWHGVSEKLTDFHPSAWSVYVAAFSRSSPLVWNIYKHVHTENQW